MSKKITFVPYAANIRVNEKIVDINYVLGKLHKHLASANEATLAKAREYQVKGADWKRVQALEEAEQYIKASKLLAADVADGLPSKDTKYISAKSP